MKPNILREFLVHVPDFPNVLPRRLAARGAHVDGAQPLIKSGRLPFFGVTLAEHHDESEPMRIIGRVMLMKAENEEEVKGFLPAMRMRREELGIWIKRQFGALRADKRLERVNENSTSRVQLARFGRMGGLDHVSWCRLDEE